MALGPGPFKNRAARNHSTVSKRVLACVHKEGSKVPFENEYPKWDDRAKMLVASCGCRRGEFFFIFVPKSLL